MPPVLKYEVAHAEPPMSDCEVFLLPEGKLKDNEIQRSLGVHTFRELPLAGRSISLPGLGRFVVRKLKLDELGQLKSAYVWPMKD